MPRPAGVLNGEGEKPLAPVKKWTHRHEMIVYYHVVHMMTGESIAEAVNLTPGRVSQILNDPYAQERIREIKQRIRMNLMENVEGRLTRLADNALSRIEHSVNREDLDLFLHPEIKKHQDRLSFDILTKLGVLGRAEDADGDKGKGQKELTEPLMKKLMYALEKSNEAEEIRRAEREGKVIEAEATVVEAGGEGETEADVLISDD